MNKKIVGVTVGTPIKPSKITEKVENKIGDIESALDSIIEIQNSLIGGEEE